LETGDGSLGDRGRFSVSLQVRTEVVQKWSPENQGLPLQETENPAGDREPSPVSPLQETENRPLSPAVNITEKYT